MLHGGRVSISVMTICKRILSAAFGITIFIVSATLYMNLRYTIQEANDPSTIHSINKSAKKNIKHWQQFLSENVALYSTRNPIQKVKRLSQAESGNMLESERSNIVKEMRDYKFGQANVTMDSLIPERGGQPTRAVVICHNI